MKLLRFGFNGEEKPGIVDADGRVRDLMQDCPRHFRRSVVR